MSEARSYETLRLGRAPTRAPYGQAVVQLALPHQLLQNSHMTYML